MVVRHGGEDVVRHVGVGDVVKHLVQHAVVAVQRAQRPLSVLCAAVITQSYLDPGPVLAAVVGQRGVGVLQVGDEHQPHVHNQQRHDVHLPHINDPFPITSLALTSHATPNAAVRNASAPVTTNKATSLMTTAMYCCGWNSGDHGS